MVLNNLLLLFTPYAVANMRLLALARWRRVRRTQLVQNMTRKNAYTVVTTFMMTSKNAYMVVTR